jgi:pre-mRNA-splicing factor CWC26
LVIRILSIATMPGDLSTYLATHYLTADSKPAKKRKRKHGAESGLLVTDDDGDWPTARAASAAADDSDVTATVAGTSSEFRRAKTSGWKTIGTPAPSDVDQAAADAIIASAAAENEAARRADDEAPVVEGEDGPEGGRDAPGVQMMSDGTHAGLQSGAAVAAQLKMRQKAERAELENMRRERRAKGLAEDEGEHTVYRDATGARIDVSLRRDQARKAAAEAEQRELQKEKLLKGDIQAEEARQRREALEDAAVMPLARGKDDEEINREMRSQMRWNDPMAQFLPSKQDSGSSRKAAEGGKGHAQGKGPKGRPVYQGAATPNRYGIRPGYRWDGVDRGNGFEAERFKALNRREMNKNLSYSWQMDE